MEAGTFHATGIQVVLVGGGEDANVRGDRSLTHQGTGRTDPHRSISADRLDSTRER